MINGPTKGMSSTNMKKRSSGGNFLANTLRRISVSGKTFGVVLSGTIKLSIEVESFD